jgi:uncharacterized protein (TIGR02646 family)
MKYIKKNNEPLEITEWKKKFKNTNGREPQYEDISHDQKHKELLKESLLSEQGKICCYCCKRIGAANSHIEHFCPKGNQKYKMMSLKYGNLMASCQGIGDKGENCGHSKGDIFDEKLLISPLNEDCEINFIFSSRGKIMATDGNVRAQYTIDALKLDTPRLNAAREAAMWESGAMDVETEEECQKLMCRFSSKDETGQYAEFCDAILYHLKEMMHCMKAKSENANQ